MDVLADRYELGRTLGSGGMARVVEAHDRLLDRTVAVKLLRDDIAADPSARERFLREARTAARFTHPNAVTVFDTGEDGRQPWIVMELIRGEDLSRRLTAAGALAHDEAARITDDILAALGAAHANGMVHRDVKPANIMLLDDGRVKLADFGIAKSLQDTAAGMTATGQIIGTAKYLSPEQVEGRPATPASDVYAMGVVLYEMLAGVPPFTGDSAVAIALAHTRDPVPNVRRAVPGISPTLAAVVERALAKDPTQRFADAGEMRRALRGERVAAAMAPTVPLAQAEATRVLPTREPAPIRRSSPLPLILLALGVLALVAAILASANDDPPQQQDQPAEVTEPAEEPDAPATATEGPADEPTESQVTEPPATTEPPADEPTIDLPTDLPSLITLLDLQPELYGTKQEEFLSGLQKVTEQDGEKQAMAAAKLMDQSSSWAEKGELDADVVRFALPLLAAYAAEDGGDGEEGKGKGDD